MRGVIPSPSVVAAKAARPLQQKCDSAVAHKFCPEKKINWHLCTGSLLQDFVIVYLVKVVLIRIGTVPTHYKERTHFFSTEIRYLCSIL